MEAEQCFEEGEFQEALDKFNAAVDMGVATDILVGRIYYYRAKCYKNLAENSQHPEKRRRLRKLARKDCKKSCQLSPSWPMAFYQCFSLYKHEQKHQKALSYIEEACRLSTGKKEDWIEERAQCREAAGRESRGESSNMYYNPIRHHQRISDMHEALGQPPLSEHWTYRKINLRSSNARVRAAAICGEAHEAMVSEDYKTAFSHFLSAAAEEEDPEGMYNLALCYFGGFGCAKNTSQAITWLKKATRCPPEDELLGMRRIGVGESLHKLGLCFYEGVGVEQDYNEAVQYWSRAVASPHENAFAMHNLGLAFFYGKGCEQDVERGLELVRAAAVRGDSEACLSMAKVYQTVRRSTPRALIWAEAAKREGNLKAVPLVERLQEQLKKEDELESSNPIMVQCLRSLEECVTPVVPKFVTPSTDRKLAKEDLEHARTDYAQYLLKKIDQLENIRIKLDAYSFVAAFEQVATIAKRPYATHLLNRCPHLRMFRLFALFVLDSKSFRDVPSSDKRRSEVQELFQSAVACFDDKTRLRSLCLFYLDLENLTRNRIAKEGYERKMLLFGAAIGESYCRQRLKLIQQIINELTHGLENIWIKFDTSSFAAAFKKAAAIAWAPDAELLLNHCPYLGVFNLFANFAVKHRHVPFKEKLERDLQELFQGAMDSFDKKKRLRSLCFHFLDVKNVERDIPFTRQALRDDPQFYPLRYRLACFLSFDSKLRNYQEAIQQFERARKDGMSATTEAPVNHYLYDQAVTEHLLWIEKYGEDALIAVARSQGKVKDRLQRRTGQRLLQRSQDHFKEFLDTCLTGHRKIPAAHFAMAKNSSYLGSEKDCGVHYQKGCQLMEAARKPFENEPPAPDLRRFLEEKSHVQHKATEFFKSVLDERAQPTAPPAPACVPVPESDEDILLRVGRPWAGLPLARVPPRPNNILRTMLDNRVRVLPFDQLKNPMNGDTPKGELNICQLALGHVHRDGTIALFSLTPCSRAPNGSWSLVATDCEGDVALVVVAEADADLRADLSGVGAVFTIEKPCYVPQWEDRVIMSLSDKHVKIGRKAEDAELCWCCLESQVNLSYCKGCGKAKYCSRACQRRDWRKFGHRHKCKTRDHRK